MSNDSSVVTAQHFAYLAERTLGEDAFLGDLKAAARADGIPPIWVAPEQASFLQILVKLTNAKNIVEVGTLAGTTAIHLARAAGKGGRVRTIELSEKHADFARDWVQKSDVADRVEVLTGTGDEHLAAMEDGTIDILLLDADKSGYPGYLKHGMRILRTGGMLLADNAFAFGQLLDENPTDREVGAVRAFNDLVPTVDGLHAVIVPIGDGMWCGVKES
tara:strand:- start:1548 stop:2201 length:654 start_codon:yes stop_codon:yes gene_type:complete